MQQSVLFHAKPIYEELPGWKGVDITECGAPTRNFGRTRANTWSISKKIHGRVHVDRQRRPRSRSDDHASLVKSAHPRGPVAVRAFRLGADDGIRFALIARYGFFL